tara:strand:- start:2713 stop:2865 length:153 start_codon:yes stop_codon:yes gene_type:complete
MGETNNFFNDTGELNNFFNDTGISIGAGRVLKFIGVPFIILYLHIIFYYS